MGRYALIIFTNAVEGREREFDDWYDTHLDHMLEMDGCVAAQRFRYVPTKDSAPDQRCLAIYEYETDDIEAVAKRMSARMSTAEMPNSDAKAETIGWFFEAITERRTAPNVTEGEG